MKWRRDVGIREKAAEIIDADIYWAKVSGVNPTTGVFTSPKVTINMILLFKITFVAMMFVYMGSKISKLIIKQLGGRGFSFAIRSKDEYEDKV